MTDRMPGDDMSVQIRTMSPCQNHLTGSATSEPNADGALNGLPEPRC
jgi:hypothetical protein